MISDKMKCALRWLCAGGGTLVPAFGYFTSYPPPLFPGISVITAALAAAIIYVVYAHVFRHTRHRLYRLLQQSCVFLVVALVLLVLYALLLGHCTVVAPQNDGTRFQIGFAKCDWSLTELGLTYKSSTHGSKPVTAWMLAEAAFQPGGTERLWKSWSISVAGIIMIITYLAAFVCWTCGFSLLAKHHALKTQENRTVP